MKTKDLEKLVEKWRQEVLETNDPFDSACGAVHNCADELEELIIESRKSKLRRIASNA